MVKEMEAAKSDLAEARDSLAGKKLKWATIQSYYSMFHSARALLYSKGYREKSHYALSIAIEELFSNEIGLSMVNAFRDAMDLRQEADYGLKFSEAGATETIEAAEKLLARVKEILKVK
ncbi:MAG: HEPN domain-containing protein [Nitrososphaera sp.]